MNVIKDNIESRRKIYSDSWRPYKNEDLNAAGLEHFKK